MRRSTVTALTAVLLAGAAVGCTGSGEGRNVSKKERFLDAAHSAHFESWAEKGPPDDELAPFPQKWCDALAAGQSTEYILNPRVLYPNGPQWGTKVEDARKLLVLGVGVYCPNMSDRVAEELGPDNTASPVG
ncbi:DUF732 domain-containing protein [Streptomyces sp. NPDC088354]|uniref:DUF732 domain-containing protein n=1 Tax=Streptomyces sp. NPDC088354 TaxID=3365856 RepID=UPI003800DD3E